MTTLRSKWLCGLLFLVTSSSLFAQHYTRTDLTANAAGVSASATVHIDANLVNAWGLARGSGSPWWVADNGTGKSTLYDSTGTPQSLVVTIPPPLGQDGSSAPTGTAFNFTTGFQVAANKPAVFLFATEDGTISGWNPTVDATNAIRKVNRPQKAIYKGLAIAMSAAVGSWRRLCSIRNTECRRQSRCDLRKARTGIDRRIARRRARTRDGI
jgi:hypothetical protein